MAEIFLSHSSANQREAEALMHWLSNSGWADVFLDSDPNGGITVGERWQEALRRAADQCQAVVFILSRLGKVKMVFGGVFSCAEFEETRFRRSR